MSKLVWTVGVYSGSYTTLPWGPAMEDAAGSIVVVHAGSCCVSAGVSGVVVVCGGVGASSGCLGSAYVRLIAFSVAVAEVGIKGLCREDFESGIGASPDGEVNFI